MRKDRQAPVFPIFPFRRSFYPLVIQSTSNKGITFEKINYSENIVINN